MSCHVPQRLVKALAARSYGARMFLAVALGRPAFHRFMLPLFCGFCVIATYDSGRWNRKKREELWLAGARGFYVTQPPLDSRCPRGGGGGVGSTGVVLELELAGDI